MKKISSILAIFTALIFPALGQVVTNSAGPGDLFPFITSDGSQSYSKSIALANLQNLIGGGSNSVTFNGQTYSLYGTGTNSYLVTGSPSNYYNTAFYLDAGNTANSTFVYTNTTTQKVYLVFNDPFFTAAQGFPTWTLQTNFPDTLSHYEFRLNSANTNLMLNNQFNWQNSGRVYFPIVVYAQDNGLTLSNYNGNLSGTFNGNIGGTIANGLFGNADNVSNVPGFPAPPASYPTTPFTVAIDGDSVSQTNTCWHGPGYSLNFSILNQRGHPFQEAANNSYYLNFSVCGQSLLAITNRYPSNGHLVSPAVTGNPGWYVIHTGDNDYNSATTTNQFIFAYSNLLVTLRNDGWKILVIPIWTNAWTSGGASGSWAQWALPANNWLLANSQLYDAIYRADLLFATNQQYLMQGPHPTPGYFWQTSPCGASLLAQGVNSVLTPQMTYWAPAQSYPWTNAMSGGGIIDASKRYQICFTNASFGFAKPINVEGRTPLRGNAGGFRQVGGEMASENVTRRL